MNGKEIKYISEHLTVFHDRTLPAPGRPVGYAAIIEAFDLHVPLPRTLCAIGQRHKIIETTEWRIFTPRHSPKNTLEGQLTFALKWEGVSLITLKRLFLVVPDEELIALVTNNPTGRYARRIWFFYEWLTGRHLELPNADIGSYVDALDPKIQFAIKGKRVPRHRVINNLPGTSDFCPLVFRTKELKSFLERNFAQKAKDVTSNLPADILARAAAFLLLEDSKSSYAIEGEHPPQKRIERWGQAIFQAGKNALSLEELLRLQRIVIGDARFVRLGIRQQGGFVGEHDRDTGIPIPSHISARHQDLPNLLRGLIAFNQQGDLHPVITAATVAFGFVYIHPFIDGNGRIHRFLIHHVLAERGFSPKGFTFPISSAILRDIESYRHILMDHSKQILPLIDWEPTEDNNVSVLNDTADYYRYFDATPHAEYLFSCVRKTIEEDLPRETAFLKAYDRFVTRVQQIVDMPNSTLDLLFRFLRQNNGRLSKRACKQEFAPLSSEEIIEIEEIFAEELGMIPM